MWEKLHLKLSHKGILLVSVPLIFELVFIVTLYILLARADEQAKLIENNRAISAQCNQIAKHVYDSAQWMMCYINKGKSYYGKRYDRVTALLPYEIAKLKELVKSNPAELKLVGEIEVAYEKFFQALKPIKVAADRHERMQALVMGARFQGTNNELGVLVSEVTQLMDLHSQKKISPESEVRSHQQVMAWLGIGVALNILVAVALAIYFGKSTAIRLNVLMDNLRRLPAKEELNPLLDGADEIAELDRVLHRMVDKLKEAERKEREIERLKREFVSMVSHDLRTPLTSVQGTLALFSRGVYGEVPHQGRLRLASAEQSTRRLIKLVNDLLEIEKLETGNLLMHKEEVSAADMIERAVESVRGFAEQHNVSLQATSCDQKFDADGDRIVQVLVNLLSNAVKFSPAGSMVTLKASANDRDLEFRASDQGRGIPASEREAIFERFRQVELADGREKGGTGLGLAICKAIVVQHGGQIGVDSEEGKGSTFWFTIPIQQATSGAQLAGNTVANELS